MSKRPKVFFFGPLPPPTHGMAVVNAQMVGLIQRYGDVIVGDTSPGGLVRGLSYHARKAARVLPLLLRIPVARMAGCRKIYASPDDSWGGIWTIALLIVGRLTGMAITLHHHSYRYLIRPTRLMRLTVSVSGKSATHVVLGEDMGRRLTAHYPIAQNIIVCENSVELPVDRAAGEQKMFTIGLLANLTVEKGALEFIDTFKALTDANLTVRALLAGPVADPQVEAAVNAASKTHKGEITAIGAVHGAAKDRFFAGIDLFLFPTIYKTEAFPLVLMESLVRGVPVLAYRRGCIGALQGQKGVDLVEPEGDFAEAAIRLVRKNVGPEEPDRAGIAKAARERNAANLDRLDRLAAEICGVGVTAP